MGGSDALQIQWSRVCPCYAVLLLAFIDLATIVSARESAGGNVRISKSVVVRGGVTAQSVKAQSLHVSGSAVIEGALTAASIAASSVKTPSVEAAVITSPTGTVTIDGNLILVQSEQEQENQRDNGDGSFLEVAAGATIDGLNNQGRENHNSKNWKLVSYDDFDQMHSENYTLDWNVTDTSTCNDDQYDRYLSGAAAPCKDGRRVVSRLYKGLPPHSVVYVRARFHQIDTWNGETGFAAIDEVVHWTLPTLSYPTDSTFDPAFDPPTIGIINVCGGWEPDTRIGAPVEMTTRHTDTRVRVALGVAGDVACACAFGVDDVALYVR